MTENSHQTADILIIGGGLSGTMLAAQLLRRPGQRRILIIETRSELGRGEAYSATEPGHTLNGNAARMSVDPDNPDDLTRWLTDYLAAGSWPEAAEQRVPVAELFPPRGVFGLYVQQRLREARSAGEAFIRPPCMCPARQWTCRSMKVASVSRWLTVVCCAAAAPYWRPVCTRRHAPRDVIRTS